MYHSTQNNKNTNTQVVTECEVIRGKKNIISEIEQKRQKLITKKLTIHNSCFRIFNNYKKCKASTMNLDISYCAKS